MQIASATIIIAVFAYVVLWALEWRDDRRLAHADLALSEHEHTRRLRNRDAGNPWEYDVSAGRSGRL